MTAFKTGASRVGFGNGGGIRTEVEFVFGGEEEGVRVDKGFGRVGLGGGGHSWIVWKIGLQRGKKWWMKVEGKPGLNAKRCCLYNLGNM